MLLSQYSCLSYINFLYMFTKSPILVHVPVMIVIIPLWSPNLNYIWATKRYNLHHTLAFMERKVVFFQRPLEILSTRVHSVSQLSATISPERLQKLIRSLSLASHTAQWNSNNQLKDLKKKRNWNHGKVKQD